MTPVDPHSPFDLVGIGIGPANLSLAALAQGRPDLRTAWFEREPAFHWHPGLLIEGTTLQVPFLADLVTLADPTSPYGFLSYLQHQQRLFPFYVAERFHIPRAEYDAYCRWVTGQLPGLFFGHHVDGARWNAERALFELDITRLGPEGAPVETTRAHARHLAVGIGTAPHVPEPLRPLADSSAVPVIHSADYLDHRERLLALDHVTVVGSGQSGAEVFLDLLRRRPPGREGLHWITRSPAFAPMEYSKLGLEHFTPDYTRYFHGLPEPVRDRLVAGQGRLYKAIDAGTLAAIHDELYEHGLRAGWPDAALLPGVAVRTAGRTGTAEIELHVEHADSGERGRLRTAGLVLATGYRERPLDPLLSALDPVLRRDAAGRPEVTEDYRLALAPAVTGAVFVQNAELHTHGVGAPDLGLVAHRAATILNSLPGGARYPLPTRTAFTTFGLAPAGARRVPAQRFVAESAGQIATR
ncbi:lysine N(6)-hydroxylase/L-ornithine N(5)-oxygenase family protein [Streptomyces sp. PT12]|uniref:lysine N(6)-hydroxylase/L-ornithine N(5)-oxygenase family protein n=1 Tax=Streptomyces sp. PT12 TaxID=1510197 RepID=UPI000DE52A4B|nr:SidA/IucD/PvdA family monooxygenase [Streptomyces sp. PT12]RBM19691.1 lysine 6-monooxygenase [Streptomyces sp. PT12]